MRSRPPGSSSSPRRSTSRIGWTKSLPVTIGRPRLRIWTHGLEALVAIPLVAVLGAEWGATGAAVAVLASTLVFAGRLARRDPAPSRRGARGRAARSRCSREGRRRLRHLAARSGRACESRAGARGLPRRARPRRRGRDDGGGRAVAAGVSGALGVAALASPARSGCAVSSAGRRVVPTSSTRRA